jgi:hypothetical protein
MFVLCCAASGLATDRSPVQGVLPSVKNHYGTEKEAWALNGLEEPLEKKVCNDGTLVQLLCFWTFSIVLSLSKNTVLFILQNTTIPG